LKAAVPLVVNRVGSEDPGELVQDATAFAARMMDNIERSKKKVTPGNIAYYTIQHIKSGRRSTGSSTADVYGSQTQLRGRTRLTSLDEIAAGSEEGGGEIFTFNDVLSRDEEDPGTKAARNLDWNQFFNSLTARERSIIQFIIEGRTLRSLGHLLHLDDRIMHTSKRNLAAKILDFMGTDILIEVRRLPQWKQDLQAIREKMECREQRRHL